MIHDHWQLQEAKGKFSEVVRSAKKLGPQFITVHGQEMAVLLSIEDYKNLLGSKGTLVDFFQNSPLEGLDLSLSRSIETSREVEF